MTIEPNGIQISAVLFVDDLLVTEMSDGTEFHADCLAQGLCGDMITICTYHCTSDPLEKDRLRSLLQLGNLLRVRNEALDICGDTLRILGPELLPIIGDDKEMLRCFEEKQTIKKVLSLFPASKVKDVC